LLYPALALARWPAIRAGLSHHAFMPTGVLNYIAGKFTTVIWGYCALFCGLVMWCLLG
jgi:hypothetical protein